MLSSGRQTGTGVALKFYAPSVMAILVTYLRARYVDLKVFSGAQTLNHSLLLFLEADF